MLFDLTGEDDEGKAIAETVGTIGNRKMESMQSSFKQLLRGGVNRFWQSPRKQERQPWWKSMISSPARRLVDANQAHQHQPMSGIPTLVLPDPSQEVEAPQARGENHRKQIVHKVKKLKGARGNKGRHLRRQDLPKRSSVQNAGKPCLKIAVALAKSKIAVKNAVEAIEGDNLSNSSKVSKVSKRSGVQTILKAAFNTAFPLTVIKIKVLAGTLRDAGYKSANMYLVEAKIAHIEQGWPWSHLLDRHFKLCIKAPNKAPEVAEAEWAKFPLLADPHHPSTTVRMALHLFAHGVHWMMRGIELANLCTNDVKFDHKNRLVTLTWTESKMDQQGASISRTLQCLCGGACDSRCPPYAVLEALTSQARLQGNPGGALSVDVKGTRATKAQLVAGWRDVFGDTTTGHSTRRSGALQYIRKGWSISQVAFLGRWKSNIILEYAKEALQTIALNSENNPFGTLSNMINQCKESLESQANAIPRHVSQTALCARR